MAAVAVQRIRRGAATCGAVRGAPPAAFPAGHPSFIQCGGQETAGRRGAADVSRPRLAVRSPGGGRCGGTGAGIPGRERESRWPPMKPDDRPTRMPRRPMHVSPSGWPRRSEATGTRTVRCSRPCGRASGRSSARGCAIRRRRRTSCRTRCSRSIEVAPATARSAPSCPGCAPSSATRSSTTSAIARVGAIARFPWTSSCGRTTTPDEKSTTRCCRPSSPPRSRRCRRPSGRP